VWARLASFVSRLGFVYARRRLDDEARVEFDAHLDLLVDRYIRSGMTAAEARTAARRQFGSVTLIREEVHEMNGILWIDGLAQDLRIGLRALTRQPGFSLASVGTFALGIGAATAMFSVAYGIAFRPLPYPAADRLVGVPRI
jgi:putative ABC transport system permease protein